MTLWHIIVTLLIIMWIAIIAHCIIGYINKDIDKNWGG